MVPKLSVVRKRGGFFEAVINVRPVIDGLGNWHGTEVLYGRSERELCERVRIRFPRLRFMLR